MCKEDVLFAISLRLEGEEGSHNFTFFYLNKTKFCIVIEPCRKTVYAKGMFGLLRFPISFRLRGPITLRLFFIQTKPNVAQLYNLVGRLYVQRGCSICCISLFRSDWGGSSLHLFYSNKTKLCTVIEPCRKTVCVKGMYGLSRFPISLRPGGGLVTLRPFIQTKPKFVQL